MGFFGFVDKLKQLIGINKEVVEQKAEELEEEGYSITDIQDEEMEIEVPQGENIEEVLEKVYEEDLQENHQSLITYFIMSIVQRQTVRNVLPAKPMEKKEH